MSADIQECMNRFAISPDDNRVPQQLATEKRAWFAEVVHTCYTVPAGKKQRSGFPLSDFRIAIGVGRQQLWKMGFAEEHNELPEWRI